MRPDSSRIFFVSKNTEYSESGAQNDVDEKSINIIFITQLAKIGSSNGFLQW